MRRQKEGFAVPSDAEWSTYDVILLSSRLGARPNPLANWKHAISCYWVVGDPEAIGASFQGISLQVGISSGNQALTRCAFSGTDSHDLLDRRRDSAA
jgi:hypothetical protein